VRRKSVWTGRKKLERKIAFLGAKPLRELWKRGKERGSSREEAQGKKKKRKGTRGKI